MSTKKKAKKAQKRIAPRLADGEAALVVCLADKCAPRKESREVVDEARAYVKTQAALGRALHVHVEVFGCLGVCKKGPIAALVRSTGKVRVKKRVDAAKAQRLVERLAASLAPKTGFTDPGEGSAEPETA